MKIIIISSLLLLNIVANSQWFKQQSNTVSSLYKIFMINENTGWAGGSNGTVLKTTNSGSNWILYKTPVLYNISTIFFINAMTGWTSVLDDRFHSNPASGIIYKSTNGGINWIQQYSDTSNYSVASYFINESIGFIAVWQLDSGAYYILKTTNGGNDWSRYNINVYSGDGIRDILFVDQFTGFLSAGRQIYKTTNTGDIWISSNTPSNQYVHYLHFINNNTGWAYGWKTLKTTNSGLNWNIISGQSVNKFNTSMIFTNENTGFITAEHGKINYSTNSGASWAIVPSNTKYFLNEIYFVNQQTGWVVGEFGTILKTTTGGISP